MTQDWSGLARIGGEPVTRASHGYEARAAEVQTLVRDAHAHLTDVLGTSFPFEVVVAAPADWDDGEDGTPYGIPYADPDEQRVVVPAEPEGNPLVDGYARAGTWAEAARFADLVAVHEIGHLHVHALGFDLPEGWLGEFLATYLSYAFLSAHRPDDAELWCRLARGNAAAHTPTHRTLEELDELYFGVGPEDYVWFQDVLTAQVDVVHARRGIAFVHDLRAEPLTADADTAATLAAAERACPGFEEWAGTLRG